MKVQITKEFKQVCTVAKMPYARQIVAEMKEDDDINFYAQMAARIASDTNDTFEILKFSAEMALNCRVFDAFGDNTADLDVWLEIYALNRFDGFYNIGVYLTDLWNVTSENHEEIRQHMYINAYKREV